MNIKIEITFYYGKFPTKKKVITIGKGKYIHVYKPCAVCGHSKASHVYSKYKWRDELPSHYCRGGKGGEGRNDYGCQCQKYVSSK